MRFLLFGFLFFTCILGQAQPGCLKLKTGSIWELENFNGKGKAEGKTTYKVIKLDSADGIFSMRVQAITFDEKGKQLRKIEVLQECHHDTLMLDMKNYFSLRDNASYKWKAERSFIAFPSVLVPGQQLPTSTIVYTAIKAPRIATQVGPTASKNDETGSIVTFTIQDRVVELQEDITTSAGVFTSYKIKSITITRSQLDYGVPVQQELVEWFVPGVGVVKSEVSKKGKRISSSQFAAKKFK
jgi:hypothetical protein